MTRLNVTGIFETIAMSKTCGLLLRVRVNPSDVEDPFRPVHRQLDDASRLRDRDRFGQRPVRAGAAAHCGLPMQFVVSFTVCFTSLFF
jgi:hypothetical protein